jgi:uncharacterized protein YkwD
MRVQVHADSADIGVVATRGFRALPLIALVACAAVLALPAAAASPTTSRAIGSLSSLEVGVLQQLNAIRAAHGLPPLKLSTRLEAASAQHSREMGTDGYFDHSSFDGTAFWRRISHWYGQSGFGYWSVGENLLWSTPTVEPAAALQQWMASPEHRANILSRRWREVGVSAVHVTAAPGTYQGLEVTILTTDFGARH